MAHILGNSLYKSLLKVVLIPLYQMSSFAHAAEIIESMSMTVQPVLCFHIVAGFCIGIAAAREHRYKQIGRTLCASSQVIYRDSISGPVHLDCISRLMLNAHGCLGNASPSSVFIAKLCTHVRRAAAFITSAAVFFLKKSQRNAGLGQFAVDVRIIGFHVSADFLVLVREKDSFQLGVSNVLVKGPVDIGFACYL